MSEQWSPQDPTAPRAEPDGVDGTRVGGGWSLTPPGAPAPGSVPPPPPTGAPVPPPPPGAWGGPPVALVQQPGIVPLRPLDLSTMLAGAFRLLRFNPAGSLGVALIAQLLGILLVVPVLGLLWTQAGSALTDDDPTGGLSAIANLGQLPTGLVSWLATLVLCVVVSRAVIGERVSIGEAWAEARGSFWRFLGLGLLATAAVGALAAVAVLVVLGLGDQTGGFVLLAMALVALPVGVLLAIRLAFAGQVVVLERATVMGSLRRSWALTRGQFWRVLGIKLLTGLLISFVAGALTFPVALVGGVVAAATASDDLAVAGTTMAIVLGLTILLSLLVSVVTTPVQVAVDTLLYVDQRIRREGLDVQLAQVVEQRLGAER